MKKILACLVLAVVLVNCEVGVKQTKAQEGLYNGYYTYHYDEEIHDGMKFGIWWKTGESSQTGYTVFAVNLTKDSLEVALLRKQLEKINLVNSKK